jgi:hypothetical protein
MQDANNKQSDVKKEASIMNLFHKLSASALFSVLVMSCNIASATPVTWCFSGAEFSDGTSATGYLVFDADGIGNAKAVDWSIKTEALTPFDARDYLSSTGAASVFSGNSRILISDMPQNVPSVQAFNLQTSSPLTNAGGSLTFSGAYECINCTPTRQLTGSLVSTTGSCGASGAAATAVPTLPLFGLLTLGGLLGLFGLRKLKT